MSNRVRMLKAVILLAFVVLVVIVILQNTKPVETRLLFATITMPRALLLFLNLAIGYALGIATVLSFSSHRKKAAA